MIEEDYCQANSSGLVSRCSQMHSTQRSTKKLHRIRNMKHSDAFFSVFFIVPQIFSSKYTHIGTKVTVKGLERIYVCCWKPCEAHSFCNFTNDQFSRHWSTRSASQFFHSEIRKHLSLIFLRQGLTQLRLAFNFLCS